MNLPSILIYLIRLIVECKLFQFTQLDFELDILKRFKRGILIMCFVSNDHLKNEGVILNTFYSHKKVFIGSVIQMSD